MTAKSVAKTIWLLLSAVRLVPHILFMKFHPSRECIKIDIERWSSCLNLGKSPDAATCCSVHSFIELMTFHPEYRNLLYYRLGWIGKMLSPLCRPMPTLYIYTKNIGPGLFIQHGFATIISADKIGRNCWINQQVTIGFSNDTDCPTLGNNVTIYAGAKVLGNVRVGDNSIVGANAVVMKDVPENCTVVGVPAYIVRRNGMKVKEALE
jgi:serine O-acetyltransferase